MEKRATPIRARRRPAIIITSLLLCAMFVLAHGGFDHVIGTVIGFNSNVLTVKTAKGNVDVKIDAKTELSMGDHKAAAADLKPGARVVVDIPEGNKENLAHSVKIGTAAAAHEHANSK